MNIIAYESQNKNTLLLTFVFLVLWTALVYYSVEDDRFDFGMFAYPDFIHCYISQERIIFIPLK